jgi:predicted transcriptional regulator
MVRPRSESLTPREFQVMCVLWDREEATAEEVRTALPDDLHDSTVRTMLRVLEAKGFVRRSAGGKAHVYRAAVEREGVERKAVRSLLKRFFGGSAEALVLRLIEEDQLTAEELERLKKKPARDRKKKHRGKGGSR